jgi:GAF domain-containing protein
MDRDVLRLLAAASSALAEPREVRDIVALISCLGVRTVAGADEASVTVRRPNGHFETISPTGAVADRADAIQYRFGGGPCVDVVSGAERSIRVDDAAVDMRWPSMRRIADEVALHSMLSIRLSFDGDEGGVRGLNLYSHKRNAFHDHVELTAQVFARHAAVALEAARNREQVTNLHRALSTNRDIGVAIGIIMAHRLVTRDQAYDLLRRTSQHTQRKLADIAADVAETGLLEFELGALPVRRPAAPAPET